MTDTEKRDIIIMEFERFIQEYDRDVGFATHDKEVLLDALELLHEQEPVAPVLQSGGNYVCGACGVYTVGFMHPLTGESVQTWQYCGSCGKKVWWDGGKPNEVDN